MYRIGFVFLCFLQFSCSSQVETKLNGVSFVGSRNPATQEHIETVLRVNAECAAIMPFGFIRDVNTPTIAFDTDRQWFGETKTGAGQYITLMHENELEIMLKPQLWLRGGVFTGALKMETEENWKVLEKSYEDFILNYAHLAEEANVALFCIGTELEQFIKNRPEYWIALIKKIKTIYKGKLTYAANWDEYGRTPFWNELDYIGIDAYFPLSKERVPTVDQFRAGWQSHKTKIKTLSDQYNKKILFTEYGYRSMEYTGEKPWLADRNQTKISLEGQANATEAILKEFWQEDWFAGGFIWKWFMDYGKSGGEDDNRFTPQNKPAEEVLRVYYETF
ncbi:MAG: glycoside hydrolase [Flavobacteriaceae bacterium]|nr:MAG: glycoside hydrolase [Flavobacteriaceae bacterium]